MPREQQKVPFRLIVTPCCGHMLCWVNSRLPNYCPECGKSFHGEAKAAVHHTYPNAYLSYQVDN